ncbi:Zn-binding domain-containing protein [Rhodopirellula europaea]|uniref:Zn-binding domain-containing protein n=1 Tax=Rhodopirellula europaea TaxID=1263866 RepID=UPI0030EDE697
MQRAIAIQLQRHRGEFLLKELAQSGFLPSHGFPLDVLPFVTSSAESMEQDRNVANSGRDRDDNWFRKNDFPSRQLPMAIREYAPGNSVVIDGLSYQSSGLTLHWKIPPSDEGFREPQAIRTYYQCKRCGFSKSGRSVPDTCPACGNDKIHSVRYIKPTGFAVDIRSGMPNSIDERSCFVPPTDPRINCESDWISLPNPSIGSYRHDSDGHVFHFSKGTGGHGYAICLRCGRAASEPEPDQKASPLNRGGQHKKLRTGNKKQNTDVCEGTDESFAIQRYVWLGGEEVTDVFQLRLKAFDGTDGGIDETTAVPLAIALRNALADFLGIDTREIGWAVQENRDDGFSFNDIYLYDTAAGGAGYVAATGMFIEELLEAARSQLECTCSAACHNCLLSFDTQHHAKNLDRRPAYDFLNSSFFDSLKVPESYQCFGDKTHWESGSITEGVLRQLIKPGVHVIEIVADGSAGHWDIESWKMWRHLTKLSTSDTGVKVKIVLCESIMQSLDWPVLNSLVTKAVGRSMEVIQVLDRDVVVGSGRLAARVHTASESIQWALFDEEILTPGANWGVPSPEQPTVKSRSEKLALLEGRACTLEEVKEKQPNNCKVTFVDRELDGQVTSFGELFWKQTRGASALLNDQMSRGNPTKAFYTDRYLRSPITARLLYEIVAACTTDHSSLELDILTSWKKPNRSGNNIRSDWSHPTTQKMCLEAIYSAFKTSVKNPDYRHLDHARKLTLTWEDGSSVMLVLDQGVGFMQEDGCVPFDLSLAPAKQAKDLIGRKFGIRHIGRRMPIYIMNAAQS